jgi:prepilin-type N-terminal cleavage/methylation domain-containing protein
VSKVQRRSSRAFTLVELMVVVLIIGVLAALSYSLVGAQRPRQKVNGFALELRALLHGARQTALATGNRVVVMVFPTRPVESGGVGRLIIYQDGDGDFFSDAAAVKFADYDAGGQRAGPRSEVLDVLDLPSQVVVGPATGMGATATLPAPFNGIRINVDCEFCTGADRRGAVVFAPDGSVTFQGGNGPPLALLNGASLSVTAPEALEIRTIAIASPTGALQTLHWNPTP